MTDVGALTLNDFLLARIAEDEEMAREATPGPWRVDSEQYAESVDGADGVAVISGGRWGGEASVFQDTADALHIARWDPARVLAECEAKRRIVAAWTDTPSPLEQWDDYAWNGVEVAMKYLALPYADHPDYRQEWRP